MRIQAEIRRETGLTASAGVSYNKFLAKIASDWRKPAGLTVITPQQAVKFIDQLPIERFYGVGAASAKKFRELGITNGLQLRAAPQISPKNPEKSGKIRKNPFRSPEKTLTTAGFYAIL